MTRVSQVILRSARLVLAPLADVHLPDEVALDADAEVMRFLGPVRSAAEVARWHRERLAVARRSPGLGFWAGSVDGEFVGWWLLEPPSRADQGPVVGQAELGYRLARRFWRRGLASEGARELIRYGFADLGLSRIFAETMAVNVGSRATMAAVGMRHVRTLHLPWPDPLPGAQAGEVEYAITRDEWVAGGSGAAG
ncbi:GNAT family N-acetyltransferase [Verrucosispora sp. SN26_14.1]|uniref:GNAT family N-acetyltransferase n=1 Tax=Verrucosispora sp. SN26_14.1 TaxID=2527879 RepID=UPI001911CC3A|nr:GNAT family N-acetyltransferase [Verrucosispora sp. SN26_14.1]